MSTAPIRVVIAEDHVVVREGTAEILTQQPDISVVGQAGDGASAVDLVKRLNPDVAVLDIRMPGVGGVEATKRIREQAPDTAVLILSAHDDDEYVFALLEAGASGYLLKTVRAEELVDAVRRVYNEEVVLHPKVALKVARLWEQDAHPETDGEQLTTREMEVLNLVCLGLLNKEIAQELSISIRTVEGHLKAIFQKLSVRSRTEAAMHAASHGWFEKNEASS